MFLFGKKTYICNIYEDGKEKAKRDFKGVVLKRRDNADLLKQVYTGILEIIFAEGLPGLNRSILYLRENIEKIFDNKSSLDSLIITKTYKTGYKRRCATCKISTSKSRCENCNGELELCNIAHKVLADRIMKRTGEIIPSNTRIPYVIIENKNKNALNCDKIEDPVFVRENNLKIDAIYYIEQQLKNPIIQLYMTMGYSKINDIFNKYITQYKKIKDKENTIHRFNDREIAKKEFFNKFFKQ